MKSLNLGAQVDDRVPQGGVLLDEGVDFGEEGAVGRSWTAAFALVDLDLILERLDVGGLSFSMSLLRLGRAGGSVCVPGEGSRKHAPWRYGCAPSRRPFQQEALRR